VTTTTGAVVADLGITWRQLDYWIRHGGSRARRAAK